VAGAFVADAARRASSSRGLEPLVAGDLAIGAASDFEWTSLSMGGSSSPKRGAATSLAVPSDDAGHHDRGGRNPAEEPGHRDRAAESGVRPVAEPERDDDEPCDSDDPEPGADADQRNGQDDDGRSEPTDGRRALTGYKTGYQGQEIDRVRDRTYPRPGASRLRFHHRPSPHRPMSA
jgi:hypothetical protein